MSWQPSCLRKVQTNYTAALSFFWRHWQQTYVLCISLLAYLALARMYIALDMAYWDLRP